MQFPVMRGGARYTKEVLGLNGGMNTQEAPEFIGERQLADARNVYWREGALRTRPAFSAVVQQDTDIYDEEIVATFETADNEYLFVKTLENLLVYYRGALVLAQEMCNYACRQRAVFAEDGTKVYVFLTYKDIRESPTLSPSYTIYTVLLLGENSFVADTAVPHVPTVFVNGRGTQSPHTVGSMTMNEGFNMLTNKYRGLWTTDGNAVGFRPPFAPGNGWVKAKYTHTDGEIYTFSAWMMAQPNEGVESFAFSDPQALLMDGEERNVQMVVYQKTGAIQFIDASTRYAVVLPDVGFSGNLEVTGHRDENREVEIFDMGFSLWYGGGRGGLGDGTRLFMSGDAAHPQLVRYSDVNEPLYFPENNFLNVGDRTQAVTAFGKQNGVLVIFKQREIYYCEYAYTAAQEDDLQSGAVVDVTSAAYFPLTQLHSSVGCDLPRSVRLCGNRLVWACQSGEVYMLSALSNLSEKSVRCISYAVAPSLKGMLTEGQAVLYHGNYLLFTKEGVFLFDYMSGAFTDFTSYADDKQAAGRIPWYRWSFPEWMGTPRHVLGRDDTLLVVYATGGALVRAVLDINATDRYTAMDGTVQESAIVSRVETKHFSLGRATACKSVYDLWLLMEEADGMVLASCDVDGKGPVRLWETRRCAGEQGVFSPMRIPCRQTRVRTMGVILECSGRMVLAGVTIGFRVLGETK